MAKPDDVPQWAWDRVEKTEQECIDMSINAPASQGREICVAVIARALLDAERRGMEKAAKVADDHAVAWGRAMGTGATEIAAAIRAKADEVEP